MLFPPKLLTRINYILNLRHRHNLSLTRPAVSSRGGYPNSSERPKSSLHQTQHWYISTVSYFFVFKQFYDHKRILVPWRILEDNFCSIHWPKIQKKMTQNSYCQKKYEKVHNVCSKRAPGQLGQACSVHNVIRCLLYTLTDLVYNYSEKKRGIYIRRLFIGKTPDATKKKCA